MAWEEQFKNEAWAEGRAKGREEGRAEGIAIGEKRRGQSTARFLLGLNMPLEQIAEACALSLAEVRALAAGQGTE